MAEEANQHFHYLADLAIDQDRSQKRTRMVQMKGVLTMSEENNKPYATLRDRAIRATIWKNTGERGDFYSVDFSRTYKDAQDEYRDSSSFSGTDLLKVSRLALKAYDLIEDVVAEDRARRR